jgi:hypothetical protein
MNSLNLQRITIISLVALLTGSSCVTLTNAQRLSNDLAQPSVIDGNILFAPMDTTITYLINSNGNVEHTWSSDYIPGEAVLWLGDGTILRTIKVGGPGSGGAGGGVQKIKWDNTLEWDFRYNTEGNLTHHDIKMLPNGDILMIAWETKTKDEAIAAGRNPNNIQGNTFLPCHIIEVKPTGPTTGDIVWEWHVWDHLIQDFDATKDNYGVVGDHPELADINYAESSGSDWLHSNSIDYNEQYDQILLSVYNFNEIWVIDHSTTTAEAAGHSGGNSGKGGDLLYRWGNPQAYRAGAATDQKFFCQHDATWIEPGRPGAGDILVFNNGATRPGTHYSTVDEIVPPVNQDGQYYLESHSKFGPSAQTWIYTANPPESLYSSHYSGAERLTDGNTLICDGEGGRFFEVTPDGTTVWDYTNPYPAPVANNVFKIVYIPEEIPPEPDVPNLYCSGSLSWTDISPGGTVVGSFQVQNIGDQGSLLNWTINTSSITWGTWTYSPESGDGLTPEQGPVTVQVTVTAPDEENGYFEGYVRVENRDNPDDFEVVPVSLATPENAVLSQTALRLQQTVTEHHSSLPILSFLGQLVQRVLLFQHKTIGPPRLTR